MKISKVNHNRTAVVVKEGHAMPAIGGVMYHSPRDPEFESLERNIEKRSQNAKHLYSIFSQIQSGTEPKLWRNHSAMTAEENKAGRDAQNIKHANYVLRETCVSYQKKIKFRVDKIIMNCCTKYVCSDDRLAERLKNEKKLDDFGDTIRKVVDRLQKYGPNHGATFPNYTEKFSLDDFAMLTIRKSLIAAAAKQPGFDVRKATVVFLRNIGNDHISPKDRKVIQQLFAVIREDCNKWDLHPSAAKTGNRQMDAQASKTASKGALAIRAIENQNMIVQPQDGRLTLSPISDQDKNTQIKSLEKKGLDTFLLSYAQLDKEQRDTNLRKLRRLVDVYFGAVSSAAQSETAVLPSNVDTDDAFGVWAKHSAAKHADGMFTEIPKDLQAAADQHTKLAVVYEKQLMERLKADIRLQNIRCYRFCRAITEKEEYKELFFADASINRFWIHHIENAVERILKGCKTDTLFKLRVGYLSEKVWKDALNLLSVKYIAIGKAVYHFALEDMTKDASVMKLGQLNDRIKNGITSFDYEMMKAQETLQREIAVSVAFSANNFARATMDMRSRDEKDTELDVLLWGKRKKSKKKDGSTWQAATRRRYEAQGATLAAILQFFGGKSNWDTTLFASSYKGKADYELALWDDLRKALYAVRNESFHFKTAALDGGSWNTELFGKIFAKDTETCLTVEKEKFYSNNLYRFYSDADLRRMLDRLYGAEVSREAQVPSFHSILPRKALLDFMNGLGGKGSAMNFVKPWSDAETLDQWYSACYYLLKEIYYNLFLPSEDEAWNLFDAAIRKLKDETENKREEVEKAKDKLKELQKTKNTQKEIRETKKKIKEAEEKIHATDNFIERYKVLKKDCSLAKICQTYMTDYNQQNDQFRKVRSAEDPILQEPIYQHYKLLLKKVLLSAFASYIKDEKNGFCFLAKPKKELHVIKQEEFLAGWHSAKYQNLVQLVQQQPALQKWYIVGRFMNARMLNLLLGSMRSYLQYVGDITKRAAILKSELHIMVDEKEQEEVRTWIRILEVCLLLSGRISNQASDYFIVQEDAGIRAEDAYAEYLANYVAFDASKYSALLQFSKDEKIDLYVDAANLKVNRNIVQAKLFAPESILCAGSNDRSPVIDRITKEEIRAFYEIKEKLASAKNKGTVITRDEQRDALIYQKQKNRLELRDLVEYGELINELLGQLINWSFMRERDLLYFQLGFHYSCLRNVSEKPELYKRMGTADGKTIENAVLYQIMAMYIGGYPVYAPKEDTDGFWGDQDTSGAGKKIGRFCKYAKLMKLKDDPKGAAVYYAGLELFENVEEHDNIKDLRNMIDHFWYYQGRLCLLDLYGEVFDRFFTYDLKYQKNVLNQFSNILLRHHVIMKPKITTKKNGKAIGKEEKVFYKDRAAFLVEELKSDIFTYKCKENEKDTTLKTDAKDERYLKTVAKILYYPENEKEEGAKSSDVKIRNQSARRGKKG